jgi:hypothetical protein
MYKYTYPPIRCHIYLIDYAQTEITSEDDEALALL